MLNFDKHAMSRTLTLKPGDVAIYVYISIWLYTSNMEESKMMYKYKESVGVLLNPSRDENTFCKITS